MGFNGRFEWDLVGPGSPHSWVLLPLVSTATSHEDGKPLPSVCAAHPSWPPTRLRGALPKPIHQLWFPRQAVEDSGTSLLSILSRLPRWLRR